MYVFYLHKRYLHLKLLIFFKKTLPLIKYSDCPYFKIFLTVFKRYLI